jgi:hypothetical protein
MFVRNNLDANPGDVVVVDVAIAVMAVVLGDDCAPAAFCYNKHTIKKSLTHPVEITLE